MDNMNAPKKNAAVEVGPEKEPVFQQIVVTAAGDCTLGKNHKIPAKNSWGELFDRFGPKYFLQHVSGIFKSSDLAIANLEGVLSTNAQR